MYNPCQFCYRFWILPNLTKDVGFLNSFWPLYDYTYTGELKVDLGSLGVKSNTPVVDKYSPMAYAVAQHVHWKLSPHRGIETHNRVALEHVHIQQAMSLFRELSMECIRCCMRRNKRLEVSMGGLSEHQLVVAPPFWVAQMDLFGPYFVVVPGYERETRGRQMKQTDEARIKQGL